MPIRKSSTRYDAVIVGFRFVGAAAKMSRRWIMSSFRSTSIKVRIDSMALQGRECNRKDWRATKEARSGVGQSLARSAQVLAAETDEA
jgi:hypothetical protein